MRADLVILSVTFLGLAGCLAWMTVLLKRAAQSWFMTALDSAASEMR